MNDQITKTQSGFVALMAAICISLILLLIAVQLSVIGWYTRFGVLEREFKAQSVTLAHDCADSAALYLVSNPAYSGNSTTTDKRGVCYVYPLQPNIPQPTFLTVRVRAATSNAYTTLQVIYNMHDIQLDATPDMLPSNGSKNTTITIQEWHEIP